MKYTGWCQNGFNARGYHLQHASVADLSHHFVDQFLLRRICFMNADEERGDCALILPLVYVVGS